MPARPHNQPRPPSPRIPFVALCIAAPAIIAGLVACYLAVAHGTVGELGYPLDDSWIHVRFAQHLARGQGFSFNPGEPTSTTTGALWTVLLAAAYRVTGEFLFTSIVINGLLSVLLCLLVYQLCLTVTASRWLALLAGLTTAVTVPLPWWTLSGMEPPLYAALALLGVLFHLRASRTGLLRNLPAAVVLALAGLARPECLLLFPLAMIDRAVVLRWVQRDEAWPRQWVRELALCLPVFVVLAAPPFIYNHRVTGLWLPSSFYSKQQWVSIAGALAAGQMKMLLYAVFIAPIHQLWSLLVIWARDNALLAGPFFIGLVWLVREVLSRRSERQSLLIPMALIVQPMVWAWLSGYRPADFQSQRYLAALNPLFLLLGLIGGRWIAQRLPLLQKAALRGLLVAAVLGASLARQPAGATTYALNVKNITEMQVTIGRWIRDHVPPGALLAVNDVGAIGVITDDPVLDLQGLVTPQVLPLRSMKEQVAGRAPTLLSGYLFDHRPDYLVIFPEWYPELASRRDLFTPVFGVRLEDNITAGRPTMVVFESVWAKEHGKEARL